MHKITVMGTSDKLYTIKNEKDITIILRTEISDAARILKDSNVNYVTLDDVYDRAQDFDSLDSMLAKEVISKAENNDVVYVVPGSAVAGDGSVKEVLKRCDDVKILWGEAPEYALLAQLTDADVSNGYTVIPAACLEEGMYSPRLPLILTAVDNEYLLRDLKILLSEEYGDEHDVYIGDSKSFSKIKIYEIDRTEKVDHNTMIYVPPKTERARYDSFELLHAVKKLRSPEGCPWDREQTHISLKRYLLEECAEVLEAIDGGDMHELMDELGDVLLQVLLHASIAGERGEFFMRDIEDNLTRKLIRRHPHVFGEANAETSDEALKQWDAIKHDEKEDKSHTSKLESVPKSMTALMRAQKVLSRAAKTELFEKENQDSSVVILQIKEKVMSLNNAVKNGFKDDCESMIGDILFEIANLSRILGVEGEIELTKKINEYIGKFKSKEGI